MTLPHPATQDAVWPHLSQPQWSLHLGATPGKTVRGAAFLQGGTLPLQSGKTLRGGGGGQLSSREPFHCRLSSALQPSNEFAVLNVGALMGPET